MFLNQPQDGHVAVLCASLCQGQDGARSPNAQQKKADRRCHGFIRPQPSLPVPMYSSHCQAESWSRTTIQAASSFLAVQCGNCRRTHYLKFDFTCFQEENVRTLDDLDASPANPLRCKLCLRMHKLCQGHDVLE